MYERSTRMCGVNHKITTMQCDSKKRWLAKTSFITHSPVSSDNFHEFLLRGKMQQPCVTVTYKQVAYVSRDWGVIKFPLEFDTFLVEYHDNPDNNNCSVWQFWMTRFASLKPLWNSVTPERIPITAQLCRHNQNGQCPLLSTDTPIWTMFGIPWKLQTAPTHPQ